MLRSNTDQSASSSSSAADEITPEIIEKKIAELASKSRPFPVEMRIRVFTSLLQLTPNNPESVATTVVRRMFDYDLLFVQEVLKNWQLYRDRAKQALANIAQFFATIELKDVISFQEHAYYCFCIAALVSGVEIKDLEKEYKKPIKTMVTGVVHPIGEWSIHSELTQQNYAKYICHVSKTGLVSIKDINKMSNFRVNKQAQFSGIRMLAIACDEEVEFDGVKEMKVDGVKRETRCLEILKHDFIHAGFLKRHYQRDAADYWRRFQQVGEIYEQICEDAKLVEKPELQKMVEVAWFFWFHELTTSIYVDGIPETFPQKHVRAHNEFASEPQILLRLAAKFKVFPALFRNEVDVEADMFKSLRIELEGNKADSGFTPHKRVKEMMSCLDLGYEYLDQQFAKNYNLKKTKSWMAALLQREFQAVSYKMRQHQVLFPPAGSGSPAAAESQVEKKKMLCVIL